MNRLSQGIDRSSVPFDAVCRLMNNGADEGRRFEFQVVFGARRHVRCVRPVDICRGLLMSATARRKCGSQP